MRRAVLSLAVLLSVLAAPGRGTAEASGPPLETSASSLAAALHCPGAFDDAAHEPVLLVHGTFADGESNWGWSYRPALQALGFDVCIVELPGNSLGDMQTQAEYVVSAVRAIAARSGEQVDIVGASQGTLHPRWAVKWWPDVLEATDDIVQLAAPNHGTAVATIGPLLGRCFASCWQMATGSDYIEALNAGDETPGDVSYTSIYTLFDELVLPQLPESTSVLDGASNILVQDLCPGRPSEHVALSTGDAVGFALTVDAFTHDGPADPGRFDVGTCLQAMAPGANPVNMLNGGGGAGFGGEYVDREPPLRPYAQS